MCEMVQLALASGPPPAGPPKHEGPTGVPGPTARTDYRNPVYSEWYLWQAVAEAEAGNARDQRVVGLIFDAIVDFVAGWWLWWHDPPLKRDRPRWR